MTHEDPFERAAKREQQEIRRIEFRESIGEYIRDVVHRKVQSKLSIQSTSRSVAHKGKGDPKPRPNPRPQPRPRWDKRDWEEVVS